MRKNGCIWVPTLATAEAEAPQFLGWCKAAVKKAHDKGVRLAAGGDTGAFHHGLNVREMEVMIEAGIPLEDVLEACTVGGWEACGGDQCGFRFGWFEKGNRADIIALETDPRFMRQETTRHHHMNNHGYKSAFMCPPSKKSPPYTPAKAPTWTSSAAPDPNQSTRR